MTIESLVLDYLRSKEWSMGNGQCPDCLGASTHWVGHPCHRKAASVGHKRDCPLAAAIASAGGSVVYLGDYTVERTEADYIKAIMRGERGRPRPSAPSPQNTDG